ncbi:hypothetical protein K438DRAFT_1785830 [Mycena galopus ATCC 62051]|nr:hypothetical protein K438DRAFT_1785830 [Mycena galopus ATCC 62051]
MSIKAIGRVLPTCLKVSASKIGHIEEYHTNTQNPPMDTAVTVVPLTVPSRSGFFSDLNGRVSHGPCRGTPVDLTVTGTGGRPTRLDRTPDTFHVYHCGGMEGSAKSQAKDFSKDFLETQ